MPIQLHNHKRPFLITYQETGREGHLHNDLLSVEWELNQSINELINESTRYAQRVQTSADPEDPDFRLWTPRPEA